MSIILKGQCAEIKVPAKAQFAANDADEFTVVVRRGNDQEYENLLKTMRGENPYSDRELMDKYIVRLEGLTDCNGSLINNDGLMNWAGAESQKSATTIPENVTDALAVIDAMMGMVAYRAALIDAVYAGVGNAALYQSARLGNLQR